MHTASGRPLGDGTTQLDRVGTATMGMLQTALAHFDEALCTEPEEAQLHFQRARLLRALGQLESARASATRCLELEPTHPGARALLPALEAAPTTPNAPSAAPWQPGTLVEQRWEVRGSARGGMGVVYFVRDRALDDLELAVKTLAPRPHARPEERARVEALFRRETQVWLDLGAHPHIVSGFFTLAVQGSLRFFMEYVPGLALDEVLRRHDGPLPLLHGLDLAVQLAAGLAFVHARGVVHRDVKPPNCLVMPDGTLRLTDFGLGKVSADAELTQDHDAAEAVHAAGLSIGGAGTPEYMAPEQWRSLGEAGAAADVYSFGAVLFELLTGQAPFRGEVPWLERHYDALPKRLDLVVRRSLPSRELLLMLMHEGLAPLPPSRLRPEVPPALDALCARCLAKSPAERPSLEQVLESLRELFTELTRRPYPRALPGPLEPSLAGENNRALSYAVMGELGRAAQILDGCLLQHPTAPRPWLNRRAIALRAKERPAQLVALEVHRALLPAHPELRDADDAAGALLDALVPLAPFAGTDAQALAAEGGLLLAACAERVHLVDARTGERRAALQGHAGTVTAVALNTHAGLCASASVDRTVRLWELPAGRPLAVLPGHHDQVTTVCLDAEGALAVSGGGASYGRTDTHARVWRTRDGAALRALPGHRGGVTALALAPGGALLASADGAGAVHLWDTGTGQDLYLFAEEGGALVLALGFEGDAALWALRADGVLERCDLRSGENTPRARLARDLVAASFSPGVSAVAAVCGEGRLWVHALAQGATATVGSPGAGVRALAWEPDAVLCAGAGGVTRWSLAPREEAPWPLLFVAPLSAGARLEHERSVHRALESLEAGDASAWEPLCALRDRTAEMHTRADLAQRVHRAAGALGESVGLRDAWLEREVRGEGALEGLCFTREGDAVLAVRSTPAGLVPLRIELRDGAVEEGGVAATVHARLSAPTEDGLHVLCATERGELVLVRRSSGRVARALASASLPPTALEVARGVGLAAVGDEGGGVRLCGLDEGERWSVRGEGAALTALAFSRDGQRLLSADQGGRVRRYRVRDGALEGAFETGDRALVELAVEGERVLTVGERASVWSFDGARERTLDGPGSQLTAGDACEGEALYATAGWGEQVRLWYGEECVRALHGHEFGVRAARFGPGGLRLATVDHRHTLRLWVLERRWRFAR